MNNNDMILSTVTTNTSVCNNCSYLCLILTVTEQLKYGYSVGYSIEANFPFAPVDAISKGIVVAPTKPSSTKLRVPANRDLAV